MKHDHNPIRQTLYRAWPYFTINIIIFFASAFVSMLLGYGINQIGTDNERALISLGGYLLLILVFALVRVWQRVDKSRRIQNLIDEKRVHLLQCVYRTDFRNHGSLGKGKLIYRLSDELEEFYQEQWRFCELLTEIFAVVVSVSVNLLWMDGRFLLLFYGLIPICVFISLKKANICVETHEARHAAEAEYRQILKEDVEGMYEISCMNQIPYFLRRFGRAAEASQRAGGGRRRGKTGFG